jgi:son of sevenless
MSVSRSQFVRHSLQLTIGRLRHSASTDRHTPTPTSPSTSSSSTRARVTTSPSYGHHAFHLVICSVLCLFDFTSLDPDHLSFHKNEILEVVKQDHDGSGWWAAMRSVANGGNGRVKWIPKAFVVPLEEQMALRLRETPGDLRSLMFDAESLCSSNSASRLNRLNEKAPSLGSHAEELESKVRNRRK